MVKWQINQIAALVKVSILNTTYSDSVCSVARAHTDTAAIEVEAARNGAKNRTAPIVAEGTDIEERTTAVAAVARHRQFKRGGKSPHRCKYNPT